MEIDIRRKEIEEILGKAKYYEFSEKEIDQLMKKIEKNKKGQTWSGIRDFHVRLMKYLFENKDLEYIQNEMFAMYKYKYAGKEIWLDEYEWKQEMKKWIKADCWSEGSCRELFTMVYDYRIPEEKLINSKWKYIDFQYKNCDLRDFVWGFLLGYGEHMEIAVLLELMDDLHGEKKERKVRIQDGSNSHNKEKWIDYLEAHLNEDLNKDSSVSGRYYHIPPFSYENSFTINSAVGELEGKIDDVDYLFLENFNFSKWDNIYRKRYIKRDNSKTKIRNMQYIFDIYAEFYVNLLRSNGFEMEDYSLLYRLEKYLPLQFWKKYYGLYYSKYKESPEENFYILNGLLYLFCKVENPYIRLRLLETAFFREKMQASYTYLVPNPPESWSENQPEKSKAVFDTYVSYSEVDRINEKIMLSKKILKLLIKDKLPKEFLKNRILKDLHSVYIYFDWYPNFIGDMEIENFLHKWNENTEKSMYVRPGEEAKWFDKMVDRTFKAIEERKQEKEGEEAKYKITGKRYWLIFDDSLTDFEMKKNADDFGKSIKEMIRDKKDDEIVDD